MKPVLQPESGISRHSTSAFRYVSMLAASNTLISQNALSDRVLCWSRSYCLQGVFVFVCPRACCLAMLPEPRCVHRPRFLGVLLVCGCGKLIDTVWQQFACCLWATFSKDPVLHGIIYNGVADTVCESLSHASDLYGQPTSGVEAQRTCHIERSTWSLPTQVAEGFQKRSAMDETGVVTASWGIRSAGTKCCTSCRRLKWKTT